MDLTLEINTRKQQQIQLKLINDTATVLSSNEYLQLAVF